MHAACASAVSSRMHEVMCACLPPALESAVKRAGMHTPFSSLAPPRHAQQTWGEIADRMGSLRIMPQVVRAV